MSAGTLAITSGDADRVAAFPSFSLLLIAIVAAAAVAAALRVRAGEVWPLAVCVLLWLPYLPGCVPDAFLIWHGPVEIAIWTAALGGVLVARVRAWPDWIGDPRIAPALAAGLAAVLSLTAFAYARPVVPGGDEPHYLVATQSLLADRDLKVENNYTQGDHLDYFGGRLRPHFLQRSTAGEIYSIHAPGLSVLLLPAFALGGYAGAVFMMMALSALAAALTWTVAWRLSGSAGGAWAGVLAVFATAPFVFHTFAIYPDGAGALIVIGAVALLVRLHDGWMPPSGIVIVTGAALAVLPWLHTRFAVLAAALGAILAVRLWARGPWLVAALLAVPLVVAAVWFAFFWIIWGTPSPLAPYGREVESSASYIGQGLTGLLFDQQFGVLATAPVYGLALVGGVMLLVGRHRRLGIELLVVCVPYAVAVATYAMWWGGSSAPARLLAAVLPLSAMAIAYAWAKLPASRPVTMALLLASVVLAGARGLVDEGRFIFAGRGTGDAAVDWLWRNADMTQALPSVHRDGVAAAWRDAAPWLLAIAVMLLVAFALARRGAGRGARWTGVTLTGAAAAMIAATAVWSLQEAQAATPERAAMATLRDLRPWHERHVDLNALRSLDREAVLRRLSIETDGESGSSLRVARVPAGEYAVIADGAAADLRLVALMGRTESPFEVVAMEEASARLRLPVAAASVQLRTEGRADGVTALRLQPIAMWEPANDDGRLAVRAARYGSARVFFFDERAYAEPGGFWTRAEGRATVVIDADDDARRSGLTLAVTAGAAATTIGLSVGEWSQSWSFTPGERRLVTLPPAERAWLVHIHSGPGFRPFRVDPASDDVRALAAWVEVP